MALSPTRRDLVTPALVAAALLVPLGVYLTLPAFERSARPPALAADPPPDIPASTLPLVPSSLGQLGFKPLITNVQIADLDKDGLPDVIACDARRNRVIWYRQASRDQWEEKTLGDRDLAAPCHACVSDLDGDGDPDIVVAVLGSVWPTNDRVGQVAWLENKGGGNCVTHVLLDDLRRVADVQAGDLNGDGKPDLVVAEFGYDHGRVVWLENKGGGAFRDHELLAAPGPINVPLVDLDGDGDLDIAVLLSQESEEVWGFENDGRGTFTPRVLFSSVNFDLGSAGLVVADLDKDGKPDFLLAAGDNLEIRYPHPQKWHGCYWLRNLGGWKFEAKKIGTLGGTYAAAAGDLDGDGDLDVVMVSMFNDWRKPGAASVVWLENDGKQNFAPHRIADRPTHLATVAVGDLNGDGRADVVAGSLHLQEPYDRLGRVSVWTSRKEKP